MLVFLFVFLTFYTLPRLGNNTQTTTTNILNGSIEIPPLHFEYYNLTIAPQYVNTFITGNFSITGTGSDNSARVFVFNSTNFQIFQANGTIKNPIYTSGSVSSGTLDIQLPRGGGQYVLLFDNTFDSATPKTLVSKLNLVSST